MRHAAVRKKKTQLIEKKHPGTDCISIVFITEYLWIFNNFPSPFIDYIIFLSLFCVAFYTVSFMINEDDSQRSLELASKRASCPFYPISLKYTWYLAVLAIIRGKKSAVFSLCNSAELKLRSEMNISFLFTENWHIIFLNHYTCETWTRHRWHCIGG